MYIAQGWQLLTSLMNWQIPAKMTYAVIKLVLHYCAEQLYTRVAQDLTELQSVEQLIW